jgi:protein tyrosine/serine phosphatase
MARIATWDRPLEGPMDRVRAWSSMLLVDHCVFRVVHPNLHRVSPSLWRSGQPLPHQLAALAKRGVRTIVNLRGGREYGSWPLEVHACERHGLELVDFVVRSREPPSRDMVLSSKRFFDELAYPALVHCKSGADRAGFFAGLYLMVHEGRPAAEALAQLAPKYGHFRFAKVGILDAFFDEYRRDGEPRGLSLIEWVERDYDPEALKRNFRPRFWSELIVDRIMRRE